MKINLISIFQKNPKSEFFISCDEHFFFLKNSFSIYFSNPNSQNIIKLPLAIGKDHILIDSSQFEELKLTRQKLKKTKERLKKMLGEFIAEIPAVY